LGGNLVVVIKCQLAHPKCNYFNDVASMLEEADLVASILEQADSFA